ncbi:hypothetical protein MP213Fo_16740 [Pseudochrobactrum sp. MP213Fo]
MKAGKFSDVQIAFVFEAGGGWARRLVKFAARQVLLNRSFTGGAKALPNSKSYLKQFLKIA